VGWRSDDTLCYQPIDATLTVERNHPRHGPAPIGYHHLLAPLDLVQVLTEVIAQFPDSDFHIRS
jgi:hypothetical protein